MSVYKNFDSDQLEELFSNFIIESWSFSKVGTFSRNEKAFEKAYIYGERSKTSSTTIAGSAYHSVLELYFKNLSNGIETDIVEMEQKAFEYIDKIPIQFWKIQKTTPCIEDCIIKANKTVTALIKNFISEVDIYTSEISEILGVELRGEEWLTINGVDIPLPSKFVLDLPIKTTSGKVVIIDHKSKKSFSDEKELAFSSGKQAIIYAKGFEEKTGLKVDEVWFIENKYSKNKDGSPQLNKFEIILDENTRKLYEAMLYEPLKRMIEAVSDPDYVYMINDMDTLEDREELYEFWARTLIAEIDDFNVPDSKRDLIEKRLKKIRNASIAMIDPKVIKKFNDKAASFITYNLSNMNNTEKIEHILKTFGVMLRVAHEIKGYSSDTFLLEIGPGVKISNVMRYHLDIANALNVSSVRIGKDLMVYEKKSYLSVEISKERTEDLLFDPKYLDGERLPIGIDNFGRTVVWDLNNHSTPHMLICGATGSGKSVSIKSTIEYAKQAGIKDIIILDPKYEFCDYHGKGIRVYNDIEHIEEQMKDLVEEMQGRAKSGKSSKTLVIFDEYADALSASRSGAALDIKESVCVGYYKPKEDELGNLMDAEPKLMIKTVGRSKSLDENLKILLQKGRSLGFRIIAATQRASVKVITGDAKVNFPVQICFRVPKEVDSKVVLDEGGAEMLAGAGDGLIRSPQYLDIVRFQAFYKK